jgi:hypothetical protein
MFFRFGSAIVLVVLISLAGVAIEKRNLELRREVSRQHYRMDVLFDTHAKLRLRSQELGAPVRMIDALEEGRLELRPPEKPTEAAAPRMPLLHWRRGGVE